MSSGVKCKNCGSTDIEEDNARGDAVCTNCGSVLESNLIVSEVQFEEVGHGSAAIGQFVSSESTGGATGYGYGKFQVGSGTESREVTIKKAKVGITNLCNQLQLTTHYIETAVNFFKMALMRHLTRGRKNTHIYAACVYITCRTEGTSHLLIDISDVLQICSYELGRTYLKLSNALCINIPSVDPCLYIMRFANRLQFGNKTHEVAMTALRIVQRMKKDSLHSGRRPTGLCGAALLIASRMHDFSRTISDVVKIVKIHESTVRKRLTEFAETPSSALTLDEFMAVDLEAEQDPPAFKAARKKDKERIQKLEETELTSLQIEINAQLEKDLRKMNKAKTRQFGKDIIPDEVEKQEADDFITESNIEAISECLSEENEIPSSALSNMFNEKNKKPQIEGLKPDLLAMCTPTVPVNTTTILQTTSTGTKTVRNGENNVEKDTADGVLEIDDLNEDEIDAYIMSEKEAHYKKNMWKQLNAEYLKDLQVREEKLAKEREEGKPEKKKRKRRKTIGPSNSAGEAIEKLLQEKRISSKINYDILRTLTEPKIETPSNSDTKLEDDTLTAELKLETAAVVDGNTDTGSDVKVKEKTVKFAESKLIINQRCPNKRAKLEAGLPVVGEDDDKRESVIIENGNVDEEEEIEPEIEPDPEPEYSSLKDMLNRDDEDEYYGYGDEQY